MIPSDSYDAKDTYLPHTVDSWCDSKASRPHSREMAFLFRIWPADVDVAVRIDGGGRRMG